MSSSSPIIPPGSPLERSLPRDNRKLLVTVSAILALHLSLLAGLLIQGCKRQDPAANAPRESEMNTDLRPLTNDPMPDQAGVEPDSRTAPSAPTGAPVSEAPMVSTPTAPSGPVNATRIPPVATSPAVNTPPEAVNVPGTTPIQPEPALRTVVYQVKVGDTLTRIAREHHTTVKAIREANGLKTDRILVGKKLKVPAGSAATGGGMGGPPVPNASATPR